MLSTRAPLLEVKDLKTYFQMEGGTIHAVDGASLTMHVGETVGVVGESGCGKSVMALSILGIVPSPGRIVGGGGFASIAVRARVVSWSSFRRWTPRAT